MKKQHRLLKNNDFQRVITSKQKLISSNFIIYYTNNSLDHIRVGIAVSTNYGNAVIRNRVKRQIKAMIQKEIDLSLQKDLVIIARKKYGIKNFQANKEEVVSLLEVLKKGDKKNEVI